MVTRHKFDLFSVDPVPVGAFLKNGHFWKFSEISEFFQFRDFQNFLKFSGFLIDFYMANNSVLRKSRNFLKFSEFFEISELFQTSAEKFIVLSHFFIFEGDKGRENPEISGNFNFLWIVPENFWNFRNFLKFSEIFRISLHFLMENNSVLPNLSNFWNFSNFFKNFENFWIFQKFSEISRNSQNGKKRRLEIGRICQNCQKIEIFRNFLKFSKFFEIFWNFGVSVALQNGDFWDFRNFLKFSEIFQNFSIFWEFLKNFEKFQFFDKFAKTSIL